MVNSDPLRSAAHIMSDTEPTEAIWTGHGGRDYPFLIHALPAEAIGPADRGVAIFARKSGTKWLPIFIGHGDLQDLIRAQSRNACLRAKKATHVHVREVRAPIAAIRTIALDLLRGNPAAVAPKGCNEPVDD